MLAYAAHRRSRRQLSPATLIAIVGVHAIALTMVALAKMEVVRIPTVITTIYPVNDPPPPQPIEPPKRQSLPIKPTSQSHLTTPDPIVPPPPTGGQWVDPGPTIPDPGPVVGPTVPDPGPPLPPKPVITMTKPTAPTLLTSGDQLRPPYPEEKRRLEQEATLRLRLAIDPRGRVTDVQPEGAADPLFLASARNHLLRYWRYKPATIDGQPVATSIAVTLRFRLDEEG